MEVFKDKCSARCLWLPLDKQLIGMICNHYMNIF